MNKITIKFLSIAILGPMMIAGLVITGPANAMTAEQISQHQQQTQRQQLQQIEADSRAREIENITAASPYVDGKLKSATDTGAAAKPAGHCAQIKTINFAGNTILSNRKIRKFTRPYENKCLTIDQINTMLNDITNAYIERGFATSRAFMEMPQTRLTDGILDIQIIQGKIASVGGVEIIPGKKSGAADVNNSEKATVDGAGENNNSGAKNGGSDDNAGAKKIGRGQIVTAFPGLSGQHLNIRDIEQGLDQMNRLGNNRAKMEIIAAQNQDGTSDIMITNDPQGRNHIAATLDNLGTSGTGEWRSGLRASHDNLMGLNDTLNISLSNSLPGDMGHRVSRSAMAALSVPFGYWTFSNNFSYSTYKTSFAMPISGDRFFNLGDTITNTFAIDRVLKRGQTYKLGATAGLAYKNGENRMRVYDLETKNDASSRVMTVVNFDVPLTLYFPRGTVYVKPGVVRGLNIFNAFDDADSNFTQKAQYTAAKLYAYSGFNFGYVSLNNSIDAQYSADELFSTESMYLGGESSVRGFRDESSMGDSGFTIRNDLTFSLGKIFASENKWLRAFTPSIFGDFGMTFSNSAYRAGGTMAGAGGKIAFRYWLIDATATYARTILSEDWMTEKSAVYLYTGLSGRF